jgi:carboxyl-terminal processing protease
MNKKLKISNKKFFLFLLFVYSLIPLKIINADTNRQETYKQLNLFGDVFQRVQEQYVEEVTDKKTDRVSDFWDAPVT